MNDQQVFNTVSKHLLTQRKKAYSDAIGCVYRLYQSKNKSPLKCAIGCLIPDNLYFKELEENNIDTIMNPSSISFWAIGKRKLAKIQKLFSQVSPNLLNALQSVHDNNEPSYWAKKLNNIGKKYDLKISKLLQRAL